MKEFQKIQSEEKKNADKQVQVNTYDSIYISSRIGKTNLQ